MRYFLLLTFIIAASAWSDVARQYPAGSEPAKGGGLLAVQYPPGQEKATHANSNLAHDYKDDRTK